MVHAIPSDFKICISSKPMTQCKTIDKHWVSVLEHSAWVVSFSKFIWLNILQCPSNLTNPFLKVLELPVTSQAIGNWTETCISLISFWSLRHALMWTKTTRLVQSSTQWSRNYSVDIIAFTAGYIWKEPFSHSKILKQWSPSISLLHTTSIVDDMQLYVLSLVKIDATFLPKWIRNKRSMPPLQCITERL